MIINNIILIENNFVNSNIINETNTLVLIKLCLFH